MIMKAKIFFLAAMASIAFVSCSNEMVETPTVVTTEEKPAGVITFGGSSSAVTRADLYGSDAATKLGGKFVVYGTKHVAAEDKTAANDAVVFNNFQVAWTANTAGKTASNSSDWDYLGLQAYDAEPTSQGVKYWDYSAAEGHTFYAFSSSDISYPKASSDRVQVNKVTSDGSSLYNKGYELIVKLNAKLNDIYFSDRVPVAKTDYDKTVSFTFRNIGAKVRFGFYETIPGYKVKIDRFYIDEDADAAVTTFPAMNNGKTDGFYAALQNVKNATATANQTLNVTYYPATTATEVINRPKVTNPSEGYNYYLKLGNGVLGTNLSDNAASPTWTDGTTGAYTPVFPFEANSNPLLLKLDFTMYADDGSPDVIKVKGARAVVPAKYVQWKSNFAYTYIFKISDKTNGTTGEVDPITFEPTDPEGLKPITFDAVVVDVKDELQETISSISKADKPVYVAISNAATGAVITPTGIGEAAGQARIYRLNKAATEAEVLAQKTGSPMGITFDSKTATVETTVPLTDGTTPSIANVKFTPSSAGTYAYVYTTTAYVAPTYELQTSGTYDSSKTYYLLSGSGAYYAVSVTSEAAFEANKSILYLQTAPGTPGVYDVKVIKVQ